MDEQALMEVLERLRYRFYGKYRGVATDVDDGAKRGRIKATVPAVLGTQKTGWCTPCVPFAGPQAGQLFLPEIGAGVWIEFEEGDVSRPIWTGCYWRGGELPDDAAPAVRVIVTKGGQKVVLDDDAGSVTVSDSNGNTVTLDGSGITLERGGKKVVVSDAEVTVNDGALEVM
jgi:uncharacterized protein involved in type VI secretion and phage assembly